MNQNRKNGRRARSDDGRPVTTCRPLCSSRFASMAWCVTADDVVVRGRRRCASVAVTGSAVSGGGGGGNDDSGPGSGGSGRTTTWRGVDQRRTRTRLGDRKPGTYTIPPPCAGRKGGSPACQATTAIISTQQGHPVNRQATARRRHLRRLSLRAPRTSKAGGREVDYVRSRRGQAPLQFVRDEHP